MMPLVSGEGVPLDLQRAGVGSRVIAAIIDLLVQLVTVTALVFADSVLVSSRDNAASAALILVEVVLVLAGYPILFEWLSRGRTLGKLAMGLRVVRDDGGPIALRHCLVRGLAGFLLEKPGLIAPIGTAAGLFTMIFNPASKRIGDLMAGTFVVNERAGPSRALLAPDFAIPWELQGWAAGLDLTRLNDQLALAIRQFVVRAPSFTPAAQHTLGEDLRRQLVTVMSPPPGLDLPTPTLLLTVIAERRRRAELSQHAPAWDSGPVRAAPAQQGPSPYAAPPDYPLPTPVAEGGFAPPS